MYHQETGKRLTSGLTEVVKVVKIIVRQVECVQMFQVLQVLYVPDEVVVEVKTSKLMLVL